MSMTGAVNKPINARFEQCCQSCGGWISVGDLIVRNLCGWVHVHCLRDETRGLPPIQNGFIPEVSLSPLKLAQITENGEVDDESKNCNEGSSNMPASGHEDGGCQEETTKSASRKRRAESDVIAESDSGQPDPKILKPARLDFSDDESATVKDEVEQRTQGQSTGSRRGLTQEQKDIINFQPSVTDVVFVNALAGCGKTTSIALLCDKILKESPNKKILYLVFNKKNEVEAKGSEKFPKEVEIRTSHAFVKRHYFGARNTCNVSPSISHSLEDISEFLFLDDLVQEKFPTLATDKKRKIMKSVSRLVRKTLDNFQASDKMDTRPSAPPPDNNYSI